MRKNLFVTLFLIVNLLTKINLANARCEGSFVNPITDLCWECVFPITFAGLTLTPHVQDLVKIPKITCACAGSPPKVGVPLAFWNATRMVDVTSEPYCLVGLGGVDMGSSINPKKGGFTKNYVNGTNQSFYHVHWYMYPVLGLLDLFPTTLCLDKENFDIGYITELDPFWGNELWSMVMHPEAALFGSQPAQLACGADCISSSIRFPTNLLFWCGGCQGSLYPFTGHVGTHVSSVQASFLLVQRIIAKLHRQGLLKGFGESEFCEASYYPFIKKTIYKTQLTYPTAQTIGDCQVLGGTEIFWGRGVSMPHKADNFNYMIWKKQHCCIDMMLPAATGGAL